MSWWQLTELENCGCRYFKKSIVVISDIGSSKEEDKALKKDEF